MEEKKPTEKRPADFKVEKVADGKLVKSKKRKLADVFVQEDIAKVSDHVTFDVIIPAFKKLIIDVATNTLNSLFYGSGVPTQNSSGGIRYGAISSNKTQQTIRQDAMPSRPENIGSVMVESYEKAQKILATINDIISRYGYARVADLFEQAGITCPWTYNNYGWTSIQSARIEGSAEGYMIIMPKALPIE